MKYRKKPVVVEAVRWDGKNHREMWDFLTGKTNEPMSAYGENLHRPFKSNWWTCYQDA